MRTVTHRPSFNLHPLGLLAAAFAAGVLCARYVNPPPLVCLVVGVCVSAAALVTFSRKGYGAATLLVVVAFASAGCAFGLAESRGVGRDRVRRFFEEGRVASGEPVELTGVLERAPEGAPDGVLLTLGVERWDFKGEARAASGRVELFAPIKDARTRARYEALALRRGARLRVLVALERGEGFRNPGVEPFTEYLERRDVDARATVKSPLLFERLDDAPVFAPLLWLDRWRGQLIAGFRRSFTPETAGVLAASALGNRQYLSRATAERFREGGTFHVLVISGLHVTFVGGCLVWLARGVTRRRAWQWAASAAGVWAYAVAVGAEGAVVRASLMFTLVALAPALGRPAGTLNALGASALALVAWRPSNLFDPSFQLTFLSVLSIVALAWPLLTKLREVGAWRPTHATPHPPSCPRALKTLAELLYWSERRHARELARSTHSYRLFKTPLAARLERARLQAPLRYAFASVVVSACVQSGLLPLLVVYFHRLSPAALVLNVVVGASMVVMSFAALATLLAAQLGAHAAAPFVWLTEAAGRLTAHAGDPLIAARLASFRLPEYAGAASAVYALYYLPLAALALVLARWSPLAPPRAASDAEVLKNARRVKLTALAFVSLLLVVVFHPLSAGRADGRLRVDFLDVGQGDAALVTFPDGTTLLVDGGGRAGGAWRERAEGGGGEAFERDARGVGESVVSEYLWWRGLDRVDFVVATHADSDHVEGLGDVLRNFEVGAALAGRAPPDDPEFAAFAEAARRAGVPLQLVARGDHMSVGGAEIDVLWPPPAPSSAPSRNNDSVVLRIRFRGRTILLAGDIEAAAERALVAGNDDALRADVVKVAHHGSRTSSTEEFVAATAPTFAVISVGLDSPFGHPHESAVRRWLARGARVLTTGACGTITVSTDGDDLRMETFVSR